MARICVFCGSRSGDSPEFAKSAEFLADLMIENDHTLIYGGGSTGIMGILADALLSRGGRVIGVIPQQLARPELMHDGVTDMRITVDMHERKALMHRLADVYIALPGGYGTLEELFEAVTWAQLEIHSRPVKILNVQGLYDGMATMLDRMTGHGFLSQHCRRHLQFFSTADELSSWIQSLPPDSADFAMH